jgi:nucleoid DNA-binding protein
MASSESRYGTYRQIDRTPTYVVDPATGTVVTVTQRKLVAYRYPSP